MRKSELRNGMLLVMRNGEAGIFIDGAIRTTSSYRNMTGYSEYLHNYNDRDSDIMKVYSETAFMNLDNTNRKIIWERDETDGSDVLTDAIRTLGVDSQIDKAIEEMSELIKALLKLRRAEKSNESCNSDKLIANIAEEIADVRITTDQLMMIFKCGADVATYEHEKIARLAKRLAEKRASDEAALSDSAGKALVGMPDNMNGVSNGEHITRP